MLIWIEIFFGDAPRIDANLKLARCPARSVAAATFAFYLADPISSLHPPSPKLRRGRRIRTKAKTRISPICTN